MNLQGQLMSGFDSNLLSESASKRQLRPSCMFVLFGATGDLSARKIAPALYNLAHDGLISDKFVVLGLSRRPSSDDQFRQSMQQAISRFSRQPLDPLVWQRFAVNWHYHQLQFDDREGYKGLAARIKELGEPLGIANKMLFYLATTPDLFEHIVDNLGAAGLSDAKGAASSVVIEKPFGRDLPSARSLNQAILQQFDESQVYRIDHYLGKETVLNILAMRFGNAIFEPMIRAANVEQVQITVAETEGMAARRGPYYEQAGAMRDMIQNHLLQLVALTAMDVPVRLRPEDIRNEKVKVLRSLRIMTPEDVARYTVRGQYGVGKYQSYRQEQGVAPDSQTETFVALRLMIDNWRWSGVPFFLRTGKRMAARTSQIVIVFKREPVVLFSPSECELRGPNRMVIRIQPNEGVSLIVDAKVPGPDMILRPVKMNFAYKSSFESASPEAYEHLLLDAILGDQTLFIRDDEAEAAWRFVDAIRDTWINTGMPKLIEYPQGSCGPPQAQQLLGDPYKQWYD